MVPLDLFIYCICFPPFSRSSKYQTCIIEASSASSATQNQSEAPEQNSVLNELDRDSCTQQDGATNEQNAQAPIEDQSGVGSVEFQKSEVMEVESALPPVNMPKEDHEMSRVQKTKSRTGQSEQDGSVLAEQGTAGPKPKKDKLARLRELGLEPPPVAKLCADDGAFVQLEPQQANPGEETLCKMLIM